MKTKLSLIVGQFNKNVNFSDDSYFKFLVTDGYNIPSKYLSTKNEKETLQELFEEYLDLYFEWAKIQLIDFRKYMINECEVIYGLKLFNMTGLEKKGKFISQNHHVKMEPYYEELLARRIRPGFIN